MTQNHQKEIEELDFKSYLSRYETSVAEHCIYIMREKKRRV